MSSPPSWTQPQSDPTLESSALSHLQWYAVLQIAANVTGWIVGILFYWQLFTNLITTIPSSGGPPASFLDWLTGSLIYLEVGVAAILAVQVTSILLLRSSLSKLSRVDPADFSTPALLVLVFLAGLVLVAGGFFPLMSAFTTFFSQMTGPAPVLQATGSLLTGLILLGTGGVISLVGDIGGVILGLWRVGARYDVGIIQAGSILTIIPLGSLVAPFLILLGANDAKRTVSRRSSPTP